MSVHVMSLCFRAKFRSPYLKAVALALADHAHDDGTNIWPSIGRVADKTEIAHRTVQYKLRDLEHLKLIECVDEGGKGAKDTREYKFNLQILEDLAAGRVEIEENKGAPDAPLRLVGCTTCTLKGAADDNKGAPGAPEPSITINKPSGAPESASYEARAPAAAKAVPRFEITQADVSWDDWIVWLSDNDRRDLVLAAQEAGRMVVLGSKWPNANSTFPKIDRTQAIERRKLREGV